MRGAAGLAILGEDMLASGNPVPWDIDAGARSRELVALLHKWVPQLHTMPDTSDALGAFSDASEDALASSSPALAGG